MELRFYDNKNPDIVTVEFKPYQTVLTPDLFVLIIDDEASRCIDSDKPTFTKDFSEYLLRRVQHIMYGTFEYKGEVFDVQVGSTLRRFGIPGLEPFLLKAYPHPFTPEFKDCFYKLPDFILIDYKDFNAIRRLIGHESIDFKQYIQTVLAGVCPDDDGLTYEDDISFFNVKNNSFELENILTSKGFRIFMEGQNNNQEYT